MLDRYGDGCQRGASATACGVDQRIEYEPRQRSNPSRQHEAQRHFREPARSLMSAAEWS